MKVRFIGFLIILFFSCSNENKQNSSSSIINNDNSVINDRIVQPDTLILVGEDIEISRIALSFYKWYLDYINHPDTSVNLTISKGNNNNCTLKNFDNYMNAIKSLGTLTEGFIDNENERILECKEYLEGYDWNLYKSSTFYEVTDNTPCETTFRYWIYNSQETADEAEIINFKKGENNVEVLIGFIFISGSERYRQYFEAKEYLVKYDNTWLIDSIVVKKKE